MNKIVLDGYNLIHRVPALKAVAEKEGFERARDELESALAGYVAGRSGVEAVVVYDSSDPQSSGIGAHGLPGVAVRYSRLADDTVVELCRDFATTGHSVRAVSSDRAGVALPLSGMPRIEVVSAEEFWKSLSGCGKPGSQSRESVRRVKGSAPAVGVEKPAKAGRAEVAYWLEAFGGEEPETGAKEREKGKKRTGKPAKELPAATQPQKPVEAEKLKEIKKKRYLRRLGRGKRK